MQGDYSQNERGALVSSLLKEEELISASCSGSMRGSGETVSFQDRLSCCMAAPGKDENTPSP